LLAHRTKLSTLAHVVGSNGPANARRCHHAERQSTRAPLFRVVLVRRFDMENEPFDDDLGLDEVVAAARVIASMILGSSLFMSTVEQFVLYARARYPERRHQKKIIGIPDPCERLKPSPSVNCLAGKDGVRPLAESGG
jgi:hypothetical protein